MIEVTSEANEHLSGIVSSSKDCEGVLLSVKGGGCAGFEYVLDFTLPKENDYLMKFGDIDVLLDPISAMHLEGTTIDYITSLMGSGFKFINPNAKKTCGCGSSFG